MLITIYNPSDIEFVWNKIGFYCEKAELINRTLVVRSALTIDEAKEILKDYQIAIRKLPESYIFVRDR
jgi:hypothetical protein